MQERPDVAPTETAAKACTNRILDDVHRITTELFAAFENEYTVFSPMTNCFELFGLDFMIDEELNVSLLEVNPGPDFQQTGDRLRNVIAGKYIHVIHKTFPSSMPIQYIFLSMFYQPITLSFPNTLVTYYYNTFLIPSYFP